MPHSRPSSRDVIIWQYKEITGSPAGLSRVNGVRRIVLKHETSTLRKGTIIYQLISNLAWVITLGRLPALPNLVWVR